MRALILLFTLLLALQQLGYTQNEQDKALALQYYQKGDYAKAAELYKDLWQKNPKQTYFYSYLYRCLLNLTEYEELESVIKKQIRKNPDQLKYEVDLGYLYRQDGRLDESTKQYQDAIEKMGSTENEVRSMANSFTSYREDDYVILVYERGNQLLHDPSKFSYELGDAYLRKDDHKQSIKSFLDYVHTNPNGVQRVKSRLQSAVGRVKVANELETVLYERIQSFPSNDGYSELLIWLFIQKKDFESAFTQVKAIDRRKSENGKRLIDLARMAEREGYYDHAIQVYEYLIQKGQNSQFYVQAKTELLKCRKMKLEEAISYTPEDVDALRSEYLAFLAQYGRSPSTSKTIVDLAHLEAFYAHNIDEAIKQLEELSEMQGLQRNMKNKAKLDLGDFYVLKGEVWEATLIYSQVDKEERDSPLGEEARFKNAKLSYYKGEFEWAQAQLNILKASTSELIANDALNLSVFITDNLGLDTSTIPMQMFSRAELLTFQNRIEESNVTLDSIQQAFANHKLIDDVLFHRSKNLMKRHRFEDAESLLKSIITDFGDELLADDATFMLASIYQFQLDKPQEAMDLYKDLLIKFKDSVLVVEARKRFRTLRGDFVGAKPN